MIPKNWDAEPEGHQREWAKAGVMTQTERAGSLTFYNLLDEMSELHEKKSHDYASRDNPSGNYHFAGELAVMFAHSPQDAGFVGRIGEKLYRLANLERDSKTPKNEGIEDTERDICVITCLWMADRRDRRKAGNPLQNQLLDLIKLMPDSQTQEIMDFIMELRAIRANHKFTQTRQGPPPPKEGENIQNDRYPG